MWVSTARGHAENVGGGRGEGGDPAGFSDLAPPDSEHPFSPEACLLKDSSCPSLPAVLVPALSYDSEVTTKPEMPPQAAPHFQRRPRRLCSVRNPGAPSIHMSLPPLPVGWGQHAGDVLRPETRVWVAAGAAGTRPVKGSSSCPHLRRPLPCSPQTVRVPSRRGDVPEHRLRSPGGERKSRARVSCVCGDRRHMSSVTHHPAAL